MLTGQHATLKILNTPQIPQTTKSYDKNVLFSNGYDYILELRKFGSSFQFNLVELTHLVMK